MAYRRGLDQASQLLGIDDAATFAAISSMRKSRSVEITGTRIGKEFIYPYTEHNRHLAQIAFGWVPNQPRLDLHLNAIQMLQIFGKDLR